MSAELHGLPAGIIDGGTAYLAERCRVLEAERDALRAGLATARAALDSCRHALEDAEADCRRCRRPECQGTAAILAGVLARLPAAGEGAAP